MATARQQQFVVPLIQHLTKIRSIEPASLVQRERLGSELSFEFALPIFIEIVEAATGLLKLDFDKVPYQILQQLLAPFEQINALFDQVRAFSPANHGNASQARDGLANTLEDHWGNTYALVRSLLGTREADSVKSEVDILASQIRTTMQLSSDALKSLNDKRSEVENSMAIFLKEKSDEFTQSGQEKLELVNQALDQVRKAAGEAGVSQTSHHFKSEANEHLVAARIWLAVSIAMVFALITFSLFGAQVLSWAGTVEPSSDLFDVLQVKYLTQKGLIVFCLFFGLVWSAKSYGASRHNYVVNKHRSNALGSFQAFVSSATDDQTKSAVLIQATQSIFAPQPSGYVKNDGDNSPASPVIEILRSVGGSKDK